MPSKQLPCPESVWRAPVSWGPCSLLLSLRTLCLVRRLGSQAQGPLAVTCSWDCRLCVNQGFYTCLSLSVNELYVDDPDKDSGGKIDVSLNLSLPNLHCECEYPLPDSPLLWRDGCFGQVGVCTRGGGSRASWVSRAGCKNGSGEPLAASGESDPACRPLEVL